VTNSLTTSESWRRMKIYRTSSELENSVPNPKDHSLRWGISLLPCPFVCIHVCWRIVIHCSVVQCLAVGCSNPPPTPNACHEYCLKTLVLNCTPLYTPLQIAAYCIVLQSDPHSRHSPCTLWRHSPCLFDVLRSCTRLLGSKNRIKVLLAFFKKYRT